MSGKRKAPTTRTTKRGAPKRSRKPIWPPKFLASLRQSGNISEACRAANVGRQTVYDYRDRHDDFGREWDEALQAACESLELEARRRAVHGVDEPVIYKGELMGVWVDPNTGAPVTEGTLGAVKIPLTIKRYSDSLLQTLLRANLPEKYSEQWKMNLSGNMGLMIQTVEGVDENAVVGGGTQPDVPAEGSGAGPVAQPGA